VVGFHEYSFLVQILNPVPARLCPEVIPPVIQCKLHAGKNVFCNKCLHDGRQPAQFYAPIHGMAQAWTKETPASGAENKLHEN
jgi:hypothetical protein